MITRIRVALLSLSLLLLGLAPSSGALAAPSPQTLISGNARLIGQTVASHGATVSVWARSSKNGKTTYIRAAVRGPNRSTWNPARTLDSWTKHQVGSGRGSVVTAGAGRVLVSWVDGSGRIALMRWDSSTGWGSKALVPMTATNSALPQLMVNPASGTRAVAYYRMMKPGSSASMFRVAVQRDGVWSDKAVGSAGDVENFPNAAAIVGDDDGNITVAWRRFDAHYGDPNGFASRLAADATTWEAPHDFGWQGEPQYSSRQMLMLEPDDSVTLLQAPPFSSEEGRVQVWNRDGAAPWTLTGTLPESGASYVQEGRPLLQSNARGDLVVGYHVWYGGDTLFAKPAGGDWASASLPSGFSVDDAVLAEDGRIAVFGIGPNPAGRNQVQVMYGAVDAPLGAPISLTSGQASRSVAKATLVPNGSISLVFSQRLKTASGYADPEQLGLVVRPG